ncbi:MAG: aminofutalosine synthase MqnE, partial [Bacteroidia bacterium]|nr:aminofutalosine synthase MqnE [Bacteroidia bacterium]
MTKRIIEQKVLSGARLDDDEAMFLYQCSDLGWLGELATHVREKKHGKNTYFNRNFHIEPT